VSLPPRSIREFSADFVPSGDVEKVRLIIPGALFIPACLKSPTRHLDAAPLEMQAREFGVVQFEKSEQLSDILRPGSVHNSN